ncbi:MAG: hypothetical protein ACOCRZ_02875 [Halothermotrichaceae bacterium]
MRYFSFSWGNNHIALRGLLSVLGHELIQPQEVSTSLIKKGVQRCPDFMCFSGKVVIGEIIKQIENGERNFIYISSKGIEACRCAETGNFLKSFFKKEYPDLKITRIGGNSTGESYANLKKHFPNINRIKHNYAYFIFFMKLEIIDMVEKESLKIRAGVEIIDNVRKLEQKYLKKIDSTNNPLRLFWIGLQFKHEIKKIHKENRVNSGLKVGLIGGEHILSELDSIMVKIKDIGYKENIKMEWRSGFKNITKISRYDNPPKGRDGFDYLKKLCGDYLHPAPSGTEIFTCAHAAEFIQEGFDGLIHIYAFGCLPQTAVKPILKNMCKEESMPLLSISIGDKFNETGIENRLEAFIDLLKIKEIPVR